MDRGRKRRLVPVVEGAASAICGRWRAESGREPRVLLRAGEVKDGEREIPLKEYAWSPDGKALLFQSSGDLYHYRLADRALRRLTQEDTKNEDARFSPDSKTVAFVRAADLWTVDVASGEERRLTQDGDEGKILNGKPDWVYWEEIWSRQSIGFWWSPDSKRIAYTRFEEEEVPTYPLLRDQAIDATVERQPYPKPGDRNPKVSVGVLELATGKTTWMKTGLVEGEDYARASASRRRAIASPSSSWRATRIRSISCSAIPRPASARRGSPKSSPPGSTSATTSSCSPTDA